MSKLSILILSCTLLTNCMCRLPQENYCSESISFCTKHKMCVLKMSNIIVGKKQINFNAQPFDRYQLEHATDFFITTLPYLTERDVTEEQIRTAISGVIIMWIRQVISLEGTPYLGLQASKLVLLSSGREIYETALFHELLHTVDEFVYDKHDANHEDQDWWSYEDILNDTYKLTLHNKIKKEK